jgi:MYXO-CTERM domain-containing protein
MKAQRLLALLGTALGLVLAALPAQATLTASRGVYAETQHCCWDVRFNIDSRSGAGASYSASSWSSHANISGTVGYAQIHGAAEVGANVTNYVYVNGVAEARDYWVDSFDVTSATLALGTPVTLRLGVELFSDVDTTGYGKGYALAVIGTGLDAGWLTGVDTRVTGDGAQTGTYDLFTYVGAHLSFVGQLKTRAWAEGNNGMGAATASTTADARFTIQSLTDGATYVSGSGASYAVPTSPVPEPHTWALMLGGVAALGAWRRRRS